MESDLTIIERLQGCGTANPLIYIYIYIYIETWTIFQRHDKIQPFPVKSPRETPENQVLRQDLRYRGPEQ